MEENKRKTMAQGAPGGGRAQATMWLTPATHRWLDMEAKI